LINKFEKKKSEHKLLGWDALEGRGRACSVLVSTGLWKSCTDLHHFRNRGIFCNWILSLFCLKPVVGVFCCIIFQSICWVWNCCIRFIVVL